jgi:uncharacterized damage-inducible protein DinB
MLHEHLTRRLRSAYRRFTESLEGLSEEDAANGARDDWRRFRYGVGLDGSIRGIVLHVGSWKHAAAQGLTSGVFPEAEKLLPRESRWDDILIWLEAGQAELARALAELGPEGLLQSLDWEGHPMTAADVISHLIEHDQYHAGQVNLLRQLRGDSLSDE